MSYLDDYLARMNVNGNTIAESQFNTTAQFINAHFAESPLYRVVQINGADMGVQLQDISSVTRSATVSLVQNVLKFMLLKPNESVNIGDLVSMENEIDQIIEYWLVSDFISDNPLYPKAKIERCNYTLQLKTGETKTLVGHDTLNRPVYNTTPIYTNVQCILRNTVSTIGLNQAINLPQGQVLLTVQYNDISRSINENDNLELYGKQYKVVGFDYTSIVQVTGCLMILAERVVNT